jgi:hypothetical protein
LFSHFIFVGSPTALYGAARILDPNCEPFDGYDKDPELARYFYQEAANRSYGPAEMEMARFYALEGNMKEASYWDGRAAQHHVQDNYAGFSVIRTFFFFFNFFLIVRFSYFNHYRPLA